MKLTLEDIVLEARKHGNALCATEEDAFKKATNDALNFVLRIAQSENPPGLNVKKWEFFKWTNIESVLDMELFVLTQVGKDKWFGICEPPKDADVPEDEQERLAFYTRHSTLLCFFNATDALHGRTLLTGMKDVIQSNAAAAILAKVPMRDILDRVRDRGFKDYILACPPSSSLRNLGDDFAEVTGLEPVYDETPRGEVYGTSDNC